MKLLLILFVDAVCFFSVVRTSPTGRHIHNCALCFLHEEAFGVNADSSGTSMVSSWAASTF